MKKKRIVADTICIESSWVSWQQKFLWSGNLTLMAMDEWKCKNERWRIQARSCLFCDGGESLTWLDAKNPMLWRNQSHKTLICRGKDKTKRRKINLQG